jgi:hypothetical protein
VQRAVPGLDPKIPERTLVIAFPDGRRWTGAQAVFGTMAQTGGMCGAMCRVMSWKPLSLLMEPGYRVFARYRGKLARFFEST